jgi:enamine deaminase RidA (YjgF/YER057c/UK114 family)
MSEIQRFGVTARWADKVVHNGTVYLVEVAATPGSPFEQQVSEIFLSVERHLAELGSGKDRLLQVTIYLTDMANLAAFNAAWEAWIPQGCAPSRACIRADLASPGYLVELVLVAALH